MGKQYNKVIKKKRRMSYLDRKDAARKVVVKATPKPAPVASAPAKPKTKKAEVAPAPAA